MVSVTQALQYSWAIPDVRAIKAIQAFGPVVEIAAGKGYWGGELT